MEQVKISYLICSTSLLNVIIPTLFAMIMVIKAGSTPKYHELCGSRNILSVMAKILKEANTAVNKTQIMNKCNLNHSQLQVYLKMMLEMKFLVRKIDNDCGEKFVATSKGNILAKEFHLLQVQMT